MKKSIFIETKIYKISYSVENMYIPMFYIHDLVVHVWLHHTSLEL